MTRLAWALLCAIALPLNGCLYPEGGEAKKLPLAAELLYRGSNCGRYDSYPAATWIDSKDHLLRVYEQLGKYTLGSTRNRPPSVDFARTGVLLVEMGQKPTGGYGLAMSEEVAYVSNGTAVLRLSWIEPSQGAILPQVITSPCILIKLPSDSYWRIHVLDQHGHLRAQVRVK